MRKYGEGRGSPVLLKSFPTGGLFPTSQLCCRLNPIAVKASWHWVSGCRLHRQSPHEHRRDARTSLTHFLLPKAALHFWDHRSKARHFQDCFSEDSVSFWTMHNGLKLVNLFKSKSTRCWA